MLSFIKRPLEFLELQSSRVAKRLQACKKCDKCANENDDDALMMKRQHRRNSVLAYK